MAVDWYTEQMTQAIAIPVADKPPANYANNTTAYTVGPVTAANFLRFLGEVSVGVITGAANVSAYLQSCNTSNGTFVNISSTNAVSFSNTSNSKLTVECRSDQLPSTGTSFVQLAILVAANSAFFQAELNCVTAHFKPASQYSLANTTLLVQTVY